MGVNVKKVTFALADKGNVIGFITDVISKYNADIRYKILERKIVLTRGFLSTYNNIQKLKNSKLYEVAYRMRSEINIYTEILDNINSVPVNVQVVEGLFTAPYFVLEVVELNPSYLRKKYSKNPSAVSYLNALYRRYQIIDKNQTILEL